MPDIYGIAIFCDDVRQEVGNKLTFVGVYDDELSIVGAPPAVLPKIAIVIFVRLREGATVDQFRLRLLYDTGGNELVLAEAEQQILPHDVESGKQISLKIVTVMSPFEAKSGGTLKPRIYVGDTEVKLGSLRIRYAEAEKVSRDASG